MLPKSTPDDSMNIRYLLISPITELRSKEQLVEPRTIKYKHTLNLLNDALRRTPDLNSRCFPRCSQRSTEMTPLRTNMDPENHRFVAENRLLGCHSQGACEFSGV